MTPPPLHVAPPPPAPPWWLVDTTPGNPWGVRVRVRAWDERAARARAKEALGMGHAERLPAGSRAVRLGEAESG